MKIQLGKTISMMLTKTGKLLCWGGFEQKKEKHLNREDPKVLSFDNIHCTVFDMIMGVNHCCITTSEGVYMMGKDDDSGKMGLQVARGNMFKKDHSFDSKDFSYIF